MNKKKINRFIPFGRPYISDGEIRAMAKTLKSGWLGAGPRVLEFEKCIKKYTGAKYAVALSSCTAALHLALIVSGVKRGDEVITSPLTYASTGNAILQLGAKPVFADVRIETYTINPEEIVKKISPKTKAIIPVHFGGLPCQMDQINKIARQNNLIVIEDAAHAIGSKYQGKMIGNSQNYVCFSFYPNKNITSNEGGILSTNNGQAVGRIKVLRANGISSEAWGRYNKKNFLPGLIMEPGYKYNLTDLQATLALEQMKKIEIWQKIREKYARIYDRAFLKIPGVFRQQISCAPNSRSSLHLYTLRINPKIIRISRQQILEKLNKAGIGAVVHYIPLHLHPYYKKKFGYKKGDFPVTELISENIFTLPLTPFLKQDEALFIARTTKELLLKYRR